jgi:hypothetical protein
MSRWTLEQHPELSNLVSIRQRHDYLPWPRRHFQMFGPATTLSAAGVHYWGVLHQQVQTELDTAALSSAGTTQDTDRKGAYADPCLQCGHPRLTHEHPDGAGECTFTASPDRSAFDSAPTALVAMCPCIGGMYRIPWVGPVPDAAAVYQQAKQVDPWPDPVSTGTSWQEQWSDATQPTIGATLDPHTGKPQRPWDTLRAKVLRQDHTGGHARMPGVPDAWGAHPVRVQVGGTEYQGVLRDGVLHIDLPGGRAWDGAWPPQDEEEPAVPEPINLDDIANRWTIARYAGIDADDTGKGWDDAKMRALITSWQDVGPLIEEVRWLRTTEVRRQQAVAWDKSAVKHIGWMTRMARWDPDSGTPEPPAPENPYR